MQYREFGTTGKKISAISLGSTRFPSEDLNDEAGLERCADLVITAAELGVNYFDIAHNYLKSQCEAIYKRAFSRIKKPVYTSSKSSSLTDTDADAVLRRIYSSLENMGLEKINFYYMWSIMNRKQYEDIMRKGGPYEGALRAKDEGLIDHIVFSSHAAPEDTAYMLSEGAYEGAIISYSLLNFTPMQQVLDVAAEKKLGIAVMNPLAGGIIPQNPNYIKNSFGIDDENVVDFALRFIYSHEAVTSILSGASNEKQLRENIRAVETLKESGKDYISYVNTELKKLSNVCTGCGYCLEGCPQKIKIPAYMQSYNMTFMDAADILYGRKDKELISDILVMKKMVLDFQELPEDVNKCIKCGKCESICTQHLPIIERLDKVVNIAKRASATKNLHKKRLDELLNKKGYKKVAFYTGGGYTSYVLEEYKKYFGIPEFELIIVDSNPQKWGQELCGCKIVSPDQMNAEHPDCVVISNYNFDEEIYQDLIGKYPKLNVVKLHSDKDVPWVF